MTRIANFTGVSFTTAHFLNRVGDCAVHQKPDGDVTIDGVTTLPPGTAGLRRATMADLVSRGVVVVGRVDPVTGLAPVSLTDHGATLVNFRAAAGVAHAAHREEAPR